MRRQPRRWWTASPSTPDLPPTTHHPPHTEGNDVKISELMAQLTIIDAEYGDVEIVARHANSDRDYTDLSVEYYLERGRAVIFCLHHPEPQYVGTHAVAE